MNHSPRTPSNNIIFTLNLLTTNLMNIANSHLDYYCKGKHFSIISSRLSFCFFQKKL
jgi:hypothetical protein